MGPAWAADLSATSFDKTDTVCSAAGPPTSTATKACSTWMMGWEEQLQHLATSGVLRICTCLPVMNDGYDVSTRGLACGSLLRWQAAKAATAAAKPAKAEGEDGAGGLEGNEDEEVRAIMSIYMIVMLLAAHIVHFLWHVL